ncbi:hypothetical protein PS862_01248 [Pseudomonas fluorescens]|uniref:Uncharacterized protein n=1 Tax=Pseudomonas fluorescens TaxID=294 RepID=A0A5E6Y5B7_PSEFL|nr:hypothetical protein PS639_06073 [Pseudomonas fluorescens]VVO69178.1 hypothetical protein PS862_01248 [Pseudomonas fluorescens]
MESAQGAGEFLPDDVRLMSAGKKCCSIEINDPAIEMVLDAFFLAHGSCEREQTADRR